MRSIHCFLWVLALAASALSQSPGEAPNPEATANAASSAHTAYPNIIVITLDTTRADRMGFLGSKRGLTPNLDGLARHSAVFTHAYSQAPLTPVSHATIFTGTYPQYHQVLTFPIPLSPSLPYLPDILKAHGYHTGAFIGSLALSANWGAPGFDRGYDTYDASFSWEGFTPSKRYQTAERRGGEVVKRALAWMAKRPPGPFFMWLHLFDPHDPYDPPEPYKTRYAKALYDGEIAYMDSALGEFFAQLKSQRLFDDALIAVTADHGESLGAHGEDQHGTLLYDETIHVPLLIKLPHSNVSANRIEIAVELADIMPTLLETIGIQIPNDVQGSSMVELMKPGPEGEAAKTAWRDRGAYSQADYGHLAFTWAVLQSMRTGKYLYIQAPRRELYDEAADPKEEHNLAVSSPAVADTLQARVRDFAEKTTNTGEMPKNRMDEAKARKLMALGYIGGVNNGTAKTSPEYGADPKDKIWIANTILRITDILEHHNCPKAIVELRKAIAHDPNIATMHFYLGGCYLEKEDYATAVPELRQAVKLDPGFTHAELNLGRALMHLQKYDEAATAFEHIEKTEPGIMDAHIYLVVAYAKLNRVSDEIRACRRVLQSLPEHYGANLNLGIFLAKSGDLNGAIPSLQKAESLRPDAPWPHIALSDAYQKLGREEDAKREQAEAIRLGAVPATQGPESDPVPPIN